MADRRHDLVRHLGASLSRRAGLASLGGAVAGVIGIADIDAKKKKKKKKTATVCATGCTYTTLTAAVAGISAGGSICLKNGNYDGGIQINKAMTISNCTIDDVVTITAPEASRVFTVSMGSARSTLTLTGVGEDRFTLIGLNNAVTEGGVIAIGSSGDTGSSVGSITMTNVVLREGVATQYGGAIYGRTSGTIRMTDSAIVSCNANLHGGGIDMNGGTLTIDGTSVVRDCNAQQGAAIWLGGGARLNLTGTSVIGGAQSAGNKNDAYDSTSGFGGGVFASGGTTVNMGSTAEIRSNNANVSGGGIYAEESATLLGSATCTNTTKIADNTLGTGGGVGPQIYHVNHATC